MFTYICICCFRDDLCSVSSSVVFDGKFGHLGGGKWGPLSNSRSKLSLGYLLNARCLTFSLFASYGRRRPMGTSSDFVAVIIQKVLTGNRGDPCSGSRSIGKRSEENLEL